MKKVELLAPLARSRELSGKSNPFPNSGKGPVHLEVEAAKIAKVAL